MRARARARGVFVCLLDVLTFLCLPLVLSILSPYSPPPPLPLPPTTADGYTLFVGNLGGDATEAMLARTFHHFRSVLKVRVVPVRGLANKQYGFVCFKDPYETARAFTEMNGKHCGNKPMMIRKSTSAGREASREELAKRVRHNHTY